MKITLSNGSNPYEKRIRIRKRKPRKKKGIIVALVVVAVVLCFWAGKTLMFGESDKSTAASMASENSPSNPEEGSEPSAKELVASPLPEEVAHSFTQTSDPQERLQWCRDPERVASLLQEFPKQAVSEVPIAVDSMGEVSTQELSFERFAVTFANGEKRLLCVVRTDEGTKVDWEAYARSSNALAQWCEEAQALKKGQELIKQARQNLTDAEQLVAQQVMAMPKRSKVKLTAKQAEAAEKERLNQAWRVKLARDKAEVAREELATLEATAEPLPSKSSEKTAEVRVFVSAESYYNFRFSDDEVWRSYALSSPDVDESITAYIAADSISAQILEEAVRNGQGSQRMTLQLRYNPQDARRQQYEIERVLAVGWVKAEGDLEAAWRSLKKNADLLSP